MTELAARLLMLLNAGMPLPPQDVRELVRGLAWLEAEADRYQRLREAAAGTPAGQGDLTKVRLTVKGKKTVTEAQIDQEIDAMLLENGVKPRRPWKEILDALPVEQNSSYASAFRKN